MDTSNYGRCPMGYRGNGRPYPMRSYPNGRMQMQPEMRSPIPSCPPPCPPPPCSPCQKEPSCPAPVCDNGVASSDSSCSLADRKDSMWGMALAMPYVPWQRMGQTYDPDRALQVGTIFENLDLPFLPGRCRTCQKS